MKYELVLTPALSCALRSCMSDGSTEVASGMEDLPDSLLLIILGQCCYSTLQTSVRASCKRFGRLVDELEATVGTAAVAAARHQVLQYGSLLNGRWRAALFTAASARTHLAVPADNSILSATGRLHQFGGPGLSASQSQQQPSAGRGQADVVPRRHPTFTPSQSLPAPQAVLAASPVAGSLLQSSSLAHDPHVVEFSSFCIPGAEVTQAVTAMASDGKRLAMLDEQGNLLKALAPPQFPRPAQRPCAVGPAYEAHTVPLGALPESSSLQLLLLQPTHSPPQTLEQMSAALWPPPPSPAVPTLPIPLQPAFLSIGTHASSSAPYTTSQAASRSPQEAEQVGAEQGPGLPSTSARAAMALRSATLVLPAAPTTTSAEFKQQTMPSSRSGLQQQGASSSKGDGDGQASTGDAPMRNNHALAPESGSGYPALAAGLPRPPISGDTMTAGRAAEGPLDNRGFNKRASEQLGFQMLCHAPCLSSTTYLDLSHQSDLSDSDLSVILSRCSQTLAHACFRGTQLGPMGLLMLGTQGRLMLHSLDLSHCPAFQLDASQHAATSRRTSKTSGSAANRKAVSGSKQDNSSGGTACSSNAVHQAAILQTNRRQEQQSASEEDSGSGPASAANGMDEAAVSTGLCLPLPPLHTPPELLVTGPAAKQEGLRHRRSSSTATAHPATMSSSPPSNHSISAPRITNNLNNIQNASQGCQHCTAGHCNSIRHSPAAREGVLSGADARQHPDEDILSLSDAAGLDPALRAHQLHMRLLRSALGRLDTLRDLRLQSNNLRGLFSGLATYQAQQRQQQELSQNLPRGDGAQQQQQPKATPMAPLQGQPAQPSAPGALEAFASTLGRLHTLNVSHCQGITGVEMTALLAAATSLSQLDARGLKDLQGEVVLSTSQCRAASASPTSWEPQQTVHTADHMAAQARQQRQQNADKLYDGSFQGPQALRSLSLGWRFGRSSILSLCMASGATLLSLELGVGNCMTDALLARIARACPSLQRLRLTMATVGDEGVAAVLGSCHKLWELWLLECTGPFTPAMLLPTQAPQPSLDTPSAEVLSAMGSRFPSDAADTSLTARDSASALMSRTSPPYRWSISSLQLCGAPVLLRDADLKALISGSRRHMTGTSAQGSNSSAADPRPTPRIGGLHTLGLTNAPCITPGFLSWLAATHSNTLTHLRLEQVGAYAASHVPGPPNPGASSLSGPSIAVWRLEERDLLAALSACTVLNSLRLRHCCALSSDFVPRLVSTLPLLEHLVLDNCDLRDRGFRTVHDPYSPLQVITVARCRSVEPALSPQPLLLPSTHAQQSQPGDTQASSTARHPHRHHGSGATGNNVYEALSAQLRRPKVTSEWMVLDLLEGRTTMLPCL